MKRSMLVLILLLIAFSRNTYAEVKDSLVFGPKTFDLTERHGKDNRYTDSFSVSKEGAYFIKIQNGDLPKITNPYFIEFIINNQKILSGTGYQYPILLCSTVLSKSNMFALLIKDKKPEGSKLPKLGPSAVIVTVLPPSAKLPEGVYGLRHWDLLPEFASLLLKIKNPESFSLAITAVNLKNDLAERVAAAHKLANRKDTTTVGYFIALFNDYLLTPDVRAEAAIGLGVLHHKESIPSLLNGLVDSEEKVRWGSAKALSFYPENDTRDLLVSTIQKMDRLRKEALLNTISSADWNPLGALTNIVETSEDPYVINIAVSMLGATREPKAVEFLIKLMKEPGKNDKKIIITALGMTRDSKALDVLLQMAGDEDTGEGVQIEIANALAMIGDQRAEPVIRDMIETYSDSFVVRKLRAAYKKLTGKAYKK